VEEYLNTTYRPDVDYVDGVLEDRNVGEFDHALLQRAILLAFVAFEEQEKILAIQNTRIQTQPTRYRVPDICVLSTDDLPERIIRKAPLVCIEVLSPEDRLSGVKTKCMDFKAMGVPQVWLFDADRGLVHGMTTAGWTEMREGRLELAGTNAFLDIQAVFAAARKHKGGR
jgi:Uma2 family endonuclease